MGTGPHLHKGICTLYTAAGHSWCPYFGQRNVPVGMHMHTLDTAVYHMSTSCTRSGAKRKKKISRERLINA